jgi:hypothetical protein
LMPFCIVCLFVYNLRDNMNLKEINVNIGKCMPRYA